MNSWKLSCADVTFPLLPHDKAPDLIAALERDGVDVGLFGLDVDSPRLGAYAEHTTALEFGAI